MRKKLAICILLAAMAGSALGQTYEDWYVDTDVVGGDGSGVDWANAYSSVAAAVTAKAGNLVTAQKIVRINVRGSTNADSTRIAPSGYTTNSSYYLWIRVDAEDRHAGVWSNSKYRLVASINHDSIVYNLPAYTVLEGMQMYNTSSLGSRTIYCTSTVYLKECIVRGGYIHGAYVGGGSRAYNCVFAGSTNGPGLTTNTYAAPVLAVNCTAVNNKTYGFHANTGTTLTAINCYAGGNQTADWGKAGTLALTNCYSADGSESTSQVAFDADCFVNVTSGSENLHLVSGSGLIGQGSSSASTYISIDIDGQARPQGGSWDVGADEFFEEEPTHGFLRSVLSGSVVR